MEGVCIIVEGRKVKEYVSEEGVCGVEKMKEKRLNEEWVGKEREGWGGEKGVEKGMKRGVKM